MNRWGLPGLITILGLMALSAQASAATVEVTESTGTSNKAQLEFMGSAAEANRLTVSVAGESEDYYDLRLVDASAAVVPGAGCSGGGSPGAPVSCLLHKPAQAEVISCHRGLCNTVPGSRWSIEMRFTLGDGGSELDASAIPDPPEAVDGRSPDPVAIKVVGGAGDDMVITAGGRDIVRASGGNDQVRTGAGDDIFFGGAQPDGADDVDLGVGINSVDYEERNDTVLYSADGLANDGAPGEGDRLLGVASFRSGSGNDVLQGGSLPPAGEGTTLALAAGDGDDVLSGSAGNDVLDGGSGNDVIEGREGDDEIRAGDGSDKVDGGDGSDALSLGAGDDKASGGSGNDTLSGDEGSDALFGGDDRDLLLGGGGDDVLSGEGGDDRLVGGEGADLLLGGGGADRILAGVAPSRLWNGHFFQSPGPLENVPDRVRCGGGRDKAGVDRRDSVRGCESVIRLRLLEFLGIFQASKSAPARLWYEVRRPGVLELTGHGVKRLLLRHRRDAPAGRLPLTPVGAAAQKLREGERVRLRIRVVFRPFQGSKVVRTRTVQLLPSPRG